MLVLNLIGGCIVHLWLLLVFVYGFLMLVDALIWLLWVATVRGFGCLYVCDCVLVWCKFGSLGLGLLLMIGG